VFPVDRQVVSGELPSVVNLHSCTSINNGCFCTNDTLKK
jgi:hypothetical protein